MSASAKAQTGGSALIELGEALNTGSRQQRDVWRAFLDPTNGRQDRLPYKQCRALAWKVSCGVASGLAVSRTESFKVIHLASDAACV